MLRVEKCALAKEVDGFAASCSIPEPVYAYEHARLPVDVDILSLRTFRICCIFTSPSYAATAKEVTSVRRGDAGLAGADVGSIFGLLGVERGIGNVIAGPLSEVLLKGNTGMGGYGSGYGPLVVFTGTTAGVVVMTAMVRWVGGWRRL